MSPGGTDTPPPGQPGPAGVELTRAPAVPAQAARLSVRPGTTAGAAAGPVAARSVEVAPGRVSPAGRLASVDVLRVLALVAVVAGHVYDGSDLMERAVQSWRLPVFFMLSGYFWSARRTLREEVAGRTRSLLVPYLVWVVLITGLVVLSGGAGWAGELRRVWDDAVLGGSYAQRPYTTTWFLTGLFAAVVVFRLLGRAPAVVRVGVVLVGLGVNVVAGEQLAQVPLSLASALAALVFLEAGRLVRRVQARTSRAVTVVGAGAAAAVAVVLVAAPADFVALDLKSGTLPVVAVLAALLVCGALLVAATSWRGPQGRTAAAVTALARPALVVIVAHPVVLALLPPEETSLPLPVVLVLALVLPLVAGLVVVRTPLSPWLAGVPQVRRVRPAPTVIVLP